MEHMTANNFFSPEQHGFISGKSCTTQLLEFLEDLTSALDNGQDIDVEYLDFCKAFDKVPHKRLLRYQRSYTLVDKKILIRKNPEGNSRRPKVINCKSHKWNSPGERPCADSIFDLH